MIRGTTIWIISRYLTCGVLHIGVIFIYLYFTVQTVHLPSHKHFCIHPYFDRILIASYLNYDNSRNLIINIFTLLYQCNNHVIVKICVPLNHINKHTHTHTHTHMFVFWFKGTLHRLNGFYTVQTVHSKLPRVKLTLFREHLVPL